MNYRFINNLYHWRLQPLLHSYCVSNTAMQTFHLPLLYFYIATISYRSHNSLFNMYSTICLIWEQIHTQKGLREAAGATVCNAWMWFVVWRWCVVLCIMWWKWNKRFYIMCEICLSHAFTGVLTWQQNKYSKSGTKDDDE